MLANIISVTDHMYVVLGRNIKKKGVLFSMGYLMFFSVSRLCSTDGMMTDERRTVMDLEEGHQN
jgi:hypothetical protein